MLFLATDFTAFPWSLLPLAGLLLILMALMSSLARRRRRGGSAALPPSEQIERNRQAAGLRGDLEQVMVEVEQLARRFSAQLEARTVRLEKLIAEADAKIEELRRLRDSPAPASPPGNSGDPVVGSEPPGMGVDPPPSPMLETELARSIYRLADAGNNSIEIARALGEHVGKVELILALRRAK